MTQPPNSGDWEQPHEQPPYQPQPGYSAAPRQGNPDAAGFFKALFDFSFKSFVTIKFAAIIYGIALVLIAVATLIGIILAFITMVQEPVVGFLTLLVVIVLAPFYLIVVRISLEFYVAMIRTSQNTAATKAEVENLRWDMSQRR